MKGRFRPPQHRRLQRGMVTFVTVLFLILIVVVALVQMLRVSTGGVADSQRMGESTAALYLAESGLDRVHGAIANALQGAFTNATCTGMPTTVGSPVSLGRGTYSVTAVSTPASCDNNTSTQCGTCTVTATGTVGTARRTVTQEIALTSQNGVFCNAATTDCTNGTAASPNLTWQLRLRNGSGVSGVAVFVLGFEQQGNNTATCAAGSNCRLQMQVDAPSNGNGAVGMQSNSVIVPAGTTYPIYQFMRNADRSLAQVGGFFLGTGTVTLTGPTSDPGAASYWNARRNSASKTLGVNTGGTLDSVGGTNDGTATSGGTCSAPSATEQSCTSWCYGGDTLAFVIAASSTNVDDAFTGVRFGTNSGVGQNIDMVNIAKYPNSTVVGAPATVDAEIWYASNPNLVGASPLGTGASSWKGRGTAAVGAQWATPSGNPNANETRLVTSGTLGNGTLTIGSNILWSGASWPTQMILPGDTITSTSGTDTVTATIVSQTTSTETGTMTTGQGGRGTYSVSNIRLNNVLVTSNNTAFNGASRTWTANSTTLNVTACSVCFLAQSDALALTGLSTGRTLNAAQASAAASYGRTEVAGGVGRYPFSGTATRVASNSGLFVGTPGTTLYIPSTSSQPAVTTPNMLLTVKSGTGVMAPGTRVTAVSAANAATTRFTVTTAPTTNLDGATICAGTCAFFVPGDTTNFSLSGNSNNFNYWTAGFTCLKGVDLVPQSVKSTTSVRGRWTEPVQ